MRNLLRKWGPRSGGLMLAFVKFPSQRHAQLIVSGVPWSKYLLNTAGRSSSDLMGFIAFIGAIRSYSATKPLDRLVGVVDGNDENNPVVSDYAGVGEALGQDQCARFTSVWLATDSQPLDDASKRPPFSPSSHLYPVTIVYMVKRLPKCCQCVTAPGLIIGPLPGARRVYNSLTQTQAPSSASTLKPARLPDAPVPSIVGVRRDPIPPRRFREEVEMAQWRPRRWLW